MSHLVSHTPSGSGSSTNSNTRFQSILDQALQAFKDTTGKDLPRPSDPLYSDLSACDSPGAILAVLQKQLPGYDQLAGSSQETSKWPWLDNTVDVLTQVLQTIGCGVGIVYPPAGAVFSAICVLLAVAKPFIDSHDSALGALAELFGQIAEFVRRLEIYTKNPITPEIQEIVVKVMAEVLSVLAIATKVIERRGRRPFFTKLVGCADVDNALRRLDKVTKEEALTVAAQALDAAHRVDDLVMTIASEVEGVESRIQRLEGRINPYRDVLDRAIEQIATDPTNVNWHEVQQALTEWLSSPDPSVNYDTAFESHREGTTTWFTQGPAFANWKTSGSLLWVHGKPGSGKTVLASAVIHNIIGNSSVGSESPFVAYFFFDFRDAKKQDAHALLSSFLAQLSHQSYSYRDKLLALYSSHRHGSGIPAYSALRGCLEEMLGLQTEVPIYLIIDALDECPDRRIDPRGIQSSRGKVLEFVKGLIELRIPNLRLFTTTRPENDICAVLKPLNPFTCTSISLNDQKGQKEGIVNYISHTAHSLMNTNGWGEENKNLVIDTLSDRADGTYRWVHCQLERLRLCVASELKHTLDELPNTLEETYTRILREIPDENRDRAHRLFQCLTVSARPLRVKELATVLAIDFTAEGSPTLNVDVRGGNHEKAIRLACSSLVTFIKHRDGSRIVQFSHFSVKEFLTSEHLSALHGVANYRILLESAHTIMAQACLAVLLRLDYRTDRKSIKKFPLADYTVTHFVSHAEFGNVISHIGDGIDTLLDTEKPHFSAWIWALRMSHSWRWTRHPEQLDAPPLYYVAELGFLGIVQHLISKSPKDASARGGFYGTPLHAAVNMGQIEVSRLLLEKCQDADIRGALDMTPLHLACRNGDSGLVQMLLDFDGQRNTNANPLHRVARTLLFKTSRAKTNKGIFARNSLNQTPLHLACEGGHHVIIPLLVDRGADVDAQDEHGRTPLHLALASLLYDHDKLKAVYTLLLKSGANVNKPDDTGRTPLHLTANLGFFCDTELVDLLVKYGANLRKKDKEGNTVLHLASGLEHLTLSHRYVQVVKLLLQSGADIHAKNEKGSTALHLASKRGYVDIVQLLLDQAVQVDVQDNYRSTPLHLALYHRHVEVVKLLLHRGASVHSRDRTGNTPLHLASDRGQRKGMALLLDKGANVNVQNDNRCTPLHFASSHHHNAAAMLLIQCGADVHARDRNGKTALHLASNLGNRKIMRLFLDKGADVDAQDNNKSTPLHLASSHYDESPANLLIKHGANVHARDNKGKTALHLASDRGNINTMKLLLDKGAKVDAKDNSNSTPLHLASSHYNEDPAKLLINRGANIGMRNKAGETPFQIASKTNHGPGRVESLLFESMCSRGQNH